MPRRAQTIGSRYAKDVVLLSLAGLTTQSYFALRSLDAQIATTRATLATREDGLNLVRRRADAGYASDLDLRQAEGTRSDAAAQLSELTRQRAIVLHQLGTLTGRMSDFRSTSSPPARSASTTCSAIPSAPERPVDRIPATVTHPRSIRGMIRYSGRSVPGRMPA